MQHAVYVGARAPGECNGIACSTRNEREERVAQSMRGSGFFADATVVITGAGAGIGAALARTFSAAGSAVAVADLNESAAAEVVSDLQERGGRAESFCVEVGDEASVAGLAEATNTALGPCSVLCVNVSVLQIGALADRTREELEWQLQVNVVGSLDTIRAYLPQLREAPRGRARILVTVSTSGLMAAKFFGIYTISKYALLGMAETLQKELEPEGIGVTALLPGPVATTHSISSAEARPKDLPGTVVSPEDAALADADTAVLSPDHELISPDHAVRNVLTDLEAAENFIVTNARPYPPFSVIDDRHALIRAAFERAQDGISDPHPPTKASSIKPTSKL